MQQFIDIQTTEKNFNAYSYSKTLKSGVKYSPKFVRKTRNFFFNSFAINKKNYHLDAYLLI